MPRRAWWVAGAGVVLTLQWAGQGQQPAEQPPVFRTGTSSVRVDVIATASDGQPALNLSADDFELVEDGKPQAIQTFKLVHIDSGRVSDPDGAPRPIRSIQDEVREAARDDVRLIGIFLDDYHVERDNSRWAREQIARFIETEIAPSDLTAVMYPLDPIGAVRFTRNHESIRNTILQFLGRKGDYDPMNDIERGYVYRFWPLEIGRLEQIRHEVSLSALKSLITRLGGLKEGRKSLILISEGYPNTLQMQVDLRLVYELANRYNVTIYPVDTRGLVGRTSVFNSVESLRTLAMTTDGALIANSNDIAVAMRQILSDASAYYLLGYTTAAPADGKFHEIRLRVRRPGVRVRYREGYWSPTAEEAARTERSRAPRVSPPAAIEAAVGSIDAASRAQVIRTWVGAERGENGRARVTFVWESVAGTREQPRVVSLMAAGADATPFFRGRATATGAGPVPGGRVAFDAPAGPTRLRLTIENDHGDVIETDEHGFDVPDLFGRAVVIATPVVFRTRTPREAEQVRLGTMLPAPSREFRRTERLIVPISAYGPSAPELSARVLDRLGNALRNIPVGMQAGGVPELDVVLASFEPGDYVLEISAVLGGESDTQLVGFRIRD